MEQAEQKLREREIRIANAGSIADAALALNGVFEAAQKAAEDYLRSVRHETTEWDMESIDELIQEK